MDPTKYMIIAKGKICTHRVRSCMYNSVTRKYDLTFMNGQRYSYLWNNVSYLRDPKLIQLNGSIIESRDGMSYRDVSSVYEFDDKGVKYWHFVSGKLSYDYKKSDLTIRSVSAADEQGSTDVWNYLKEISVLSEIPNDYGEIILKKYYDGVSNISKSSALYHYLNPDSKEHKPDNIIPIFPFGCNESQYKAVDNAIKEQISIIQGPPGTGKTQTILNIIANLIVHNQSVIVVSNNNSATRNVLDKLSSDRYGMGFLVAPLGSADNKREFVESQTGKYPDLTEWETGKRPGMMKELVDILQDHTEYGVQSFAPLSMIVRDTSGLSEEEIRYARNPATHLDFMIYNKVTKQPFAAVETDGYVYHKEGTAQHERDLKKNHILEVCGLPIVRLSTNGSDERNKILDALGLQ